MATIVPSNPLGNALFGEFSCLPGGRKLFISSDLSVLRRPQPNAWRCPHERVAWQKTDRTSNFHAPYGDLCSGDPPIGTGNAVLGQRGQALPMVNGQSPIRAASASRELPVRQGSKFEFRGELARGSNWTPDFIETIRVLGS